MLINMYFLPTPSVKITSTIASLLHQPDNNVIDRPTSSSQGFIVLSGGLVNNNRRFPYMAFLGGPIILSQ
jgi:hypothetical protein